MDEVEKHLPEWERLYPKRAATTLDKRTGRSYRSMGVCVPLSVYQAVSESIVPVNNSVIPKTAA